MNVTYALEGCCPLPCGNGFPCGVACKCNCWGSAFAGKQCDEPWSAYWSYYQAFFVIELLFNVVLDRRDGFSSIRFVLLPALTVLDASGFQQFRCLCALLLSAFFGSVPCHFGCRTLTTARAACARTWIRPARTAS